MTDVPIAAAAGAAGQVPLQYLPQMAPTATIDIGPDTIDAQYWAGSSPLSDFGDLDGSWSPSSDGGFSESEGCIQDAHTILDISNPVPGEYFHPDPQQQHQGDPNFCTSDYGSFEAFYTRPDLTNTLSTVNTALTSENTPSKRDFSIRGDGKHPGKKRRQRHAANQRERKRMRTINDAFEGLRERIPQVCNNKKLSKVDTLKMAIRYIRHLADLIQSCGDGHPKVGARKAEPSKVVVRCQSKPALFTHDGLPLDPSVDPLQEAEDDLISGEDSIYGHSLSWRDDRQPHFQSEQKCHAPVWYPSNPSHSDLVELNAAMSSYKV